MKMTIARGMLSAGLLMIQGAASTDGATVVLNPGPGTDYLAYWCGGQQVNEIATGFDDAASAVTLVKVSTTCHGSGRGSPNQYYLACWSVTFAEDGSILSKDWLATNHWVQGHPSIPCPESADPAAVFTRADGAGNFPATLTTSTVSGAYRAVLQTTCDPVDYGDAVSGAITGPGNEPCYSFEGTYGDGVRCDVNAISNGLEIAQEVRRPDGTVLCSTASGSAACILDASGLYTIVIRNSGGATGSYDLSLTLLSSCAAAMFDVPTFLQCFGGPSIQAAGNCVCADDDTDGDVDLHDFAAFQATLAPAGARGP